MPLASAAPTSLEPKLTTGHQQSLNQAGDTTFTAWKRRKPSPLEDWTGSTFVKMVEPTEVNANRSARLPGGRMSLDEAA